MNEEDKDRRIQQMCNFIIQEAREKVNEIELKTENDFALEKQMMVHKAKLKLQEEFQNFEKNIETEKRIKIAKAETEGRLELLNERERVVQGVKSETLLQVEKILQDKENYKSILEKLIVQGLIKINERQVTIECREEDSTLVESVLENAVTCYRKLIKDATGGDVECKVKVVTSTKLLSGGVKLIAGGGKLVCDNTLESRTEIAYEQMMPSIRKVLFTTA